MTLEDIIKELKKQNPNPKAQTNNEPYEMTGEELEAFYLDSAKSILATRKEAEAKAAAAVKKAEILDRVGLTADEAKLLLS